jgi:RND family efflux transporter MFP subunit
MPLMTGRILQLASTLICAAAAATGCADGAAAPGPPAGPPPVAVQTLRLAASPVRETVEYLGTLTSRGSVEIRPQVSGYVRAIHVRAGDRVEAGTVLVEIDSREEAAAVDSAKAQGAAARAALTQARRNAARVEALQREGLAPAEELERARSDVALAQAATREADASVSQRKVQLQFFDVVAPSGGVIGDIPVRVGDAVTAGQALTSLTQSAELELSVLIPSERARGVEAGKTMLEVLGSDGGTVLATPAFFVSPEADPRTQLVEVKARVDNSLGLRESELVRTRVVYEEREAVQVPALAVVRQSGQAYLFVVAEAGGARTVVKKPVSLGTLRPGGYELLSGVPVAERIAVSSIQSLRDGSAVTLAEPQSANERAPGAHGASAL